MAAVDDARLARHFTKIPAVVAGTILVDYQHGRDGRFVGSSVR